MIKISSDDLVSHINYRAIKWTDKHGCTHVCEGSNIVPGDAGTFVLWARCTKTLHMKTGSIAPGSLDVPVDAAFVGGDQGINCYACINYILRRPREKNIVLEVLT